MRKKEKFGKRSQAEDFVGGLVCHGEELRLYSMSEESGEGSEQRQSFGSQFLFQQGHLERMWKMDWKGKHTGGRSDK